MSTLFSKINLIIALFLFKTLKMFFKNREIWIIGAAGGKKYTDNGVTLYNYVLKELPEIEIYWVINKDAPEIEKAKKGGPFLYRGTIKSNLYTLLAKVLIATHRLPKDVSDYSEDKYQKAIKVFISHGIEGIKSKNPADMEVHKLYDISVSVSEFEKDIKVKGWGLDEHKVCVTGLPRYDDLDRNKKEPKEKIERIFYMPTWRPEYKETFEKPINKLTQEEIDTFKETSYYKNINKLLSNKEFIDTLKENDIELNLFFHQTMNPFMEKIIDLPDYSKINVLSNANSIRKEILENDLFITDYSSVCWDFLYQKKPVIFYQFDQEEYFERTGTFLKVPDDFFGPVVKSDKEVVYETKRMIEEEKRDLEVIEKAKQRFFKYSDDKNSQRMVDCILNLREKNQK